MSDWRTWKDWKPTRRDVLLTHLIDGVLALMTPETREVIQRGVRQSVRERKTRPRVPASEVVRPLERSQ